MRAIIVGVSLLALTAPAAWAQQQGGGQMRAGAAMSEQAGPGDFRVFFGFNKATLDAQARRVVAEAADAYKRTGAAQITVTGHADKAGKPAYNQALSERRAEAVRRELERHGVQATAVQVVADGENNPLVPTADGVADAQNRRVEIVMAQPAPPPAPPPVAMTPPPPPPPTMQAEAAPPKDRLGRFTFTLGPIYGHNFKEKDSSNGKNHTQDDFGGAELRFDALPGFPGGLALKQDILYAFNSADNGLAGRSVLSLGFAPNLGFVRPQLAANFGGVYGKGVQAGFVAGPELDLDLNLTHGFTLRPKIAYDFQLRNPELDKGILWAGLDLGIRF
jgi:outer membrane protein OmpA-like peptidoglycan-associated protein